MLFRLGRLALAIGLAAALGAMSPVAFGGEDGADGADGVPNRLDEALKRLNEHMERGGLHEWPAEMRGAPAKKVKAAYLGVVAEPADAALRAQLKLPEGVGLVVRMVAEGSPAEKAGLKPHDVLHKLGDQLLVNNPQFVTLVRLQKPGDEVGLTVIHQGRSEELKARLEEKEVPELGAYLEPGWPAGSGQLRSLMPGGKELRFFFNKPGDEDRAGQERGGDDGDRKLPLPEEKGHKTGNGAAGLPPVLNTAVRMGDIRIRDGETDILLSARGDRTAIVARDANGRTIYEGVLGAGADAAGWQAMPRDLRVKLEALPAVIDLPGPWCAPARKTREAEAGGRDAF